MLLADHNLSNLTLKWHLSNLRMPKDHWEAYETCRIPRPTLLTGCGLWRTTHLSGEIEPRKFLVWTSGLPSRRCSSVWLNVSLGPQALGHAEVGWGQGVKARKDVQMLLSALSRAKGCSVYFPRAAMLFMVLQFRRPSPCLLPTLFRKCVSPFLLPSVEHPAFSLECRRRAEEQHAPHLLNFSPPLPLGCHC